MSSRTRSLDDVIRTWFRLTFFGGRPMPDPKLWKGEITMPKHVFCAECGKKLDILRKAVPSQAKIYDLISPHICEEISQVEDVMEVIVEKSEEKSPPILDNIFDSFKFVEKLNNLESKPSPLEQETGDKRDSDHLRKEKVKSTAPTGILDNLKTIPSSTPEGDISEEPDEQSIHSE